MISPSGCGVGLRLQCSQRQGIGFVRSDVTYNPTCSQSSQVFKWEHNCVRMTDWNNRQTNNSLNLNVRRMFEFVSQYDTVAKTKLTTLNDKLNSLERQMEALEAHMTTVMSTSNQF